MLGAALVIAIVMGMSIGRAVDLLTASPRDLIPVSIELVQRRLSGSGSSPTHLVTVSSPWELRWSLQGQPDAFLQIEVRTTDGDRIEIDPQDGPGAGSAPMGAGAFLIDVTAEGDWVIEVVRVP